MSVFTRFKRDPSGFRALIELWESTPRVRREKMIEKGMDEDAAFTREALKYLLTFEDIVGFSDEELTELLKVTPERLVGIAIRSLSPAQQERFIKNAKSTARLEIRDTTDIAFSLKEVGGAQLKLVAYARELEKKGRIRTKAIPPSGYGLY